MDIAVRDDAVENLWVRIKRTDGKADAVVGVYYQPPTQDDGTDELFSRQLGKSWDGLHSWSKSHCSQAPHCSYSTGDVGAHAFKPLLPSQLNAEMNIAVEQWTSWIQHGEKSLQKLL